MYILIECKRYNQSSDAGWRGPLEVSGPFCGPNVPFGTGPSDSHCFGLLGSNACKAGNLTSFWAPVLMFDHFCGDQRSAFPQLGWV